MLQFPKVSLRKRFAVRTLRFGSIPSALRYNKSPPCGELSIVELEGFEPSSKRGTNEVSTCLFSSWFSRKDRHETTNLFLIL